MKHSVLKELDHCTICPRSCGVNRNAGILGYCGSGPGYNIGAICIHKGEEPPISGPKGICNVFFSRCNLQCLYCQNYQISRRKGAVESHAYQLEEVTGRIIEILEQGIDSLGFVTPSHHLPHVKAIISQLHKSGYFPVTVYNTNGYDKTEGIQSLEGLIDVYLPDFKYMDANLAKRYSDAEDYPAVVKKSILEMYRQKGSTVVLNDQDQAYTGLIIRHLVLPGQIKDSIKILQWIADELSPSVSISLMSQYYPTVCVAGHPDLGRRLVQEEYQEVLEAMEELSFTKGWIQELDGSDRSRPVIDDPFVPDFRRDHPFEDKNTLQGS
jgi:putative pyruvate formate lyase activating enzyme